MTSFPEKNLHFIPRFILREFKSDHQPPAAPARSPPPQQGKGRKKKRRDFLVHKVDLDKCILTQRPVSSEFSLVNMYRDPGFDDNPYHLEDKLSELESQASNALRKARETFSSGSILDLSRLEVDILRKFLFLMKYRNTGMFDRYNHDQVDSYDADDRDQMLEYMAANGFSKPRDVWFHNLLQLLDVQMDAKKTWIGALATRMYPDDAKMFELHLTHSFMAFCTPESAEDEFLLTQNAYGIFEGPSTVRVDPCTGKMEAVIYNEYHNFAPISPRLIIILRSHFLSPPGEQSDLQEVWDVLGAAVRSRHLYPDKAGSMLQDLPVRPCSISYASASTPHKSPLRFHSGDRFHFPCFSLSPAHVAAINNLLLEEAHPTSSIVYHSRHSLQRSIEDYFRDESDGFKHVLDHPLDKRNVYLTKLERILHDLGGTAQCKVKRFGVPSGQMHMSLYVAVTTAIQLLQTEAQGSLPYIYHLLRPDGNQETFWHDLHQASLMLMLRTKLDKGLRHSTLTKEDQYVVRSQRQDFFMTFPIERLWLYLKISRNMNKFDSDDFTVQIADLMLSGKEDKYAKMIAHFPEKRDELVPTMFYRAMT